MVIATKDNCLLAMLQESKICIMVKPSHRKVQLQSQSIVLWRDTIVMLDYCIQSFANGEVVHARCHSICDNNNQRWHPNQLLFYQSSLSRKVAFKH